MLMSAWDIYLLYFPGMCKCSCRPKCNGGAEFILDLFLLVIKPNLTRCQEKQRSLSNTSLAGKSKSPTPPFSSEPDRKMICQRDVVDPLERTSFPLPNLRDDWKTKQEKINSVPQVNAKGVQRHTSSKQTSLMALVHW